MRVAVTGGVAEGKSTVLGYLDSLGFTTAKADELAREVLRLPETQAELSQALGMAMPIEPEELRKKVWVDPAARRALNRAIHPRVLERLRTCEADFIEIPLLIEACLQGEFDRVWVVTCGPEEQRKRLLERVSDEETAAAILRAQLPTAVKSVFADVLIRTNTAPASVQRTVANAVRSA